MRLTRKGKIANYRCDYPKHTTTECIKKFGQLEDIEEELGIDLLTLFKVLNSKKAYHKKYGYYDNCSVDVVKAKIWFDNEDVKKGKPLHFEKLKDYGKTWALRKGELEI